MIFALPNVLYCLCEPNISYGIVNNKQYSFIQEKPITPTMDSIQQLTKKGATCSDLLSCLYNLKPTDLEVLLTLAKNTDATLDEIAGKVQRDRSSVHRILSKLLSANLVTKQSKTIKGGGYYHTYSMVEPEQIKKHAKERVKEITDSLELLIDRFELDLQKHLEER
jgi:predicted transcriptional regulator